MIDITQIVVALLGILAAVLTGIIIPWVKTKVDAAHWEQFENIVATAVLAAEQLGNTKLGGETLENGKAKLQYATARIKEAMARHGLSYDDELIRAAIEAAVLSVR